MTAIHTLICATRGYCSDKWTEKDLKYARTLAGRMKIEGLPDTNTGRDSLKSIFDAGRRGDKSWGDRFPPAVSPGMSRGRQHGESRPAKKNPIKPRKLRNGKVATKATKKTKKTKKRGLAVT